mgnify:CR=1 FL=1
MGEYVGKVCPFCKTEIKDGDKVKVCPECGIPHHATCWEENKGCTTSGCKEQHTIQPYVCSKCGNPLSDEQAFCPKCGTSRNATKKNVCGKCGAELQDGQESCPKCGQKIEFADVSYANTQFNAVRSKVNNIKIKIKEHLKLVVAVAAAIIAIVVVIASNPFASVDDLCAHGNYVKAFRKASRDVQKEVLAENVIAYLSEESSDKLKRPESFILREGYHYAYPSIHEDSKGKLDGRAVLYLSGENSFGTSFSYYFLYVYSHTDHTWEFWGSCTTTNFEDSDTVADKTIKALTRNVIYMGYELNKSQIKRINTQFEADTLYPVTLIDYETVDASLFPEKISSTSVD